jgi:hypothetical protein
MKQSSVMNSANINGIWIKLLIPEHKWCKYAKVNTVNDPEMNDTNMQF